MGRISHEAKEFLEAFFADLAERFLRLKTFIEMQKKAIPLERGKGFAESLSGNVDKVMVRLSNLYQTFYDLRHLDADDEEDFFLQLQALAREFEILHGGLHYLPSPWVGDEICAFAEGIFQNREDGSVDKIQNNLYKDLDGSIIFTDIWNFLRYEAHKHFPSLDEEKETKPVVWVLPKVDGNNSLAWSMLSHEMAHDIISLYNIDDVLRELLPRASNLALRKAIEIAADLIAIKLIGPAYLFSFMNMIIFPEQQNLRLCYPRDLHPSPASRVKFMIEELGRNKIDLEKIGVRYRAADDLFFPGKKFLNLFDQRLSLDTRVNHVDDTALFKETAVEERKLSEVAIQAVNSVDAANAGLPLPEFNAENCNQSLELAKGLRKKILIGSFKKEQQNKEIQSELMRYRKKSGHEDGKFSTALKKLNEKPSYVSEILNAGWFEKLFRISNMEWEIQELGKISGSDKKVKKICGLYEEYVLDLDKMLQKSIEVSAVHFSFYKEYRDMRAGLK
jgi:hypothetical protein